MNQKHSIKNDFTIMALLMLPIAVGVNFVGGQIASLLKLPVYLDTIGTLFTAMLCGPWVGGLSGILTNLILGISNPVFLAFIPVNFLTGFVAGFLARGKMYGNWWKWVISMVLMSLVSIISTAPIVVLMFGGVTGSGTSIITATAMAAGANIWSAVIGTEVIFTVADRVISFFVSYLVIKVVPSRTLVKFSCGENYIKKQKIESAK